MCGIAGIISNDQSDLDLLEVMTDSLSHRGPDNRGFFRDGTVGIGHRRLSIIDLSEAANQPMQNEDGSIQLICNGEIYNFKEKTVELEAKGHTFRSKSDNEVLIHLYEEYGDDLLNGVNGMFAFALWDGRKKRMLTAVDRFGKKPLYYVFHNGSLIFASEMKALLFFKWVKKEIDHNAIDRYLSLRHIPAPMTVFKMVRKLEQSMMMVWQNGNLKFKHYWRPEQNDYVYSNGEYVDAYEEIFLDAVKLRLQSDVPLGIYLSGGIDSSAIAGCMRSQDAGKKISYTVSFDYKYDEHPRAVRIARYNNYDYNPVTVERDDFDLLPSITYHLDEPFGDLLCLPAFILAKKAKEKLTVVLTGDGADEILNGYFHQKLMMIRNKYNSILDIPGIGIVLSRFLNAIPSSLLNRFFDYPDSLGPREKLKLMQALESSGEFGAFYDGITSCFTEQDKARLYSLSFKSNMSREPLAEEYQKQFEACNKFTFNSRLSLIDLKYWIPFSVLFRLDKMNMAHAVETRSPFLDYRVVQFALNLPDEAKINRKRNKEVLRCLIERQYPPQLREKGKQAFYMPLTSYYKDKYWLWITTLLTRESVSQRGLFNWSYIESLIMMFKNGSMLASRQLTSLAMLELWFRVFIDGDYYKRETAV
jgi:asparagine synthase (glutamine-hydrolysing)